MSGVNADTAVGLPAPALRSFITKYAGFRISGLPSGVHFGLPSSGVHLIISLGNPIELLQTPNCCGKSIGFHCIRQWSARCDPPSCGRMAKRLGCTYSSNHSAFKQFWVLQAPTYHQLVLSLADIWGSRAEALIETLLDATAWSERFAIMDRAFASKLNPVIPRPEISWAWERLAKSRGSVPVQQLADEIGYSRRHFSQRFRDEIGVSPKLAARLFRFERACRLIADSRLGLAHVALACGYYDQAHLTREWYALAGCSPKAWVTREFPFLQDYELGGSENQPDDLEPRKPVTPLPPCKQTITMCRKTSPLSGVPSRPSIKADPSNVPSLESAEYRGLGSGNRKAFAGATSRRARHWNGHRFRSSDRKPVGAPCHRSRSFLGHACRGSHAGGPTWTEGQLSDR